ncbi:MAG: hypothetical protein WBN75_13720 [Verrucomicrobiia bacterium]|jgi:hypothetical protein
MRNLAQPRVLKLAGIAALATTLACHPRLSFWLNRPASIWYLEAVMFFCSIILWSFVFAWHTQYAHRPVFTFKIEPRLFAIVTVAGIGVAAGYHLFLDPSLRLKTPEEYPADVKQWLAIVLFSLAFNQLYFVFAPFAWLVRLFQKRRVATCLTVLFGAIVLAIKYQSSTTPIPSPLFATLLAVRIGMGFLAVSFYVRGGVLLSWWWTLLIEARHLLNLTGNP